MNVTGQPGKCKFGGYIFLVERAAPPLLLCCGRRNDTARGEQRAPCGTAACTISSMQFAERGVRAPRAAGRERRGDSVRGGREPGRALGALPLPPAVGRSSCASASRSCSALPAFPEAARRAGAHRGRLRLPARDGRELRAGRRARPRRGGARAFPGRVWEESSSFELEGARFERAYRELESVVYEDTAVNTVLAPLLGVALAAERWELGSGISLVRGDLCPAPPRGRVGRRPRGRRSAHARDADRRVAPQQPPPLTEARMAFRKLVTALRLLKPGGAALGSTAWWRTDDGPWQDGAARHRPAACAARRYWLEPSERARAGRAVRACARAPGAWRRAALGAGALRARLRAARGARRAVRPPACAAGAARPRRALARAARAAPGGAVRRAGPSPSRRRSCVEQAFRLERLVMRGRRRRRLPASRSASASPDAVVRELEDNLRALLRDMVCGHLAPDLRRHRRRAAGRCGPDRAGAGRPSAGTSAGSRLRGAPRRAPSATQPRRPDREATGTQERSRVEPTHRASRPGRQTQRDTRSRLDDDAADYSAAV